MNIAVKTLPPYHVACMRNVGPYGPIQIPPLWDKLMAWAEPRGLVQPDTVTLGISYDDPELTPPEKCRYDACIVVPSSVTAEGSVTLKDVPGGAYAVSEYVGTAAEIIGAWQRMFRWMPSSGYQPDDRASYERYRADYYVDKAKGIFRCEICVPVKPL